MQPIATSGGRACLSTPPQAPPNRPTSKHLPSPAVTRTPAHKSAQNSGRHYSLATKGSSVRRICDRSDTRASSVPLEQPYSSANGHGKPSKCSFRKDVVSWAVAYEVDEEGEPSGAPVAERTSPNAQRQARRKSAQHGVHQHHRIRHHKPSAPCQKISSQEPKLSRRSTKGVD